MIFLFALFICASNGAPQPAPKTLTMASIESMSGPAAPWGIACDRGLRMGVDEINERGGIKIGKDRYLVKVVTYDHRYVPGEALTAAKKVVAEGIKYAYGLGVGVMPVMQPILEENRVFYIGSFGGGVKYTNAKFPYTFRSMPSYELTYYSFMPLLVKMWGSFKIGTVFNNDEVGRTAQTTLDKAVKELKLPVETYYEFVERDSIDFAPVITRLMAKKIDFISEELQPAQAITFVKQAWELGYKGRIGILVTGHNIETFLKTSGKEAMEGFISTLDWPPGQYPSAKYAKVRERYLSLYKEEPGSDVFRSFAAMQFLTKAMEKAGTIDVERVVKVVYDLETETLFGPTSMVGKSLGYGIKTQMAYSLPLCEVRDGQLKKLFDVPKPKE